MLTPVLSYFSSHGPTGQRIYTIPSQTENFFPDIVGVSHFCVFVGPVLRAWIHHLVFNSRL